MSDSISSFVDFCTTLQIIVKLYHWNTESFARHKATDAFGTELGGILDRFVETYIGKYNIKPNIAQLTINSKWLTDDGIVECLKHTKDTLMQMDTLFKITDSELLNIKDELLEKVDKTLYLFTLH